MPMVVATLQQDLVRIFKKYTPPVRNQGESDESYLERLKLWTYYTWTEEQFIQDQALELATAIDKYIRTGVVNVTTTCGAGPGQGVGGIS